MNAQERQNAVEPMPSVVTVAHIVYALHTSRS